MDDARFARTFAFRARSFHLAARFLPPKRRQAVAALYAFCRAMDDLADEYPADIGLPSLGAWHTWLTRLEQGQSPSAPVTPYVPWSNDDLASAATWLIEEWQLPPRYLRLLVEGAQADVTRAAISDFGELRAFCFHVAGTVGMAMCHVLGATNQEALKRAEWLGIAMQLTNVLRDVGEDLDRGRVYLPAQELQRFGVASIERRTVDAAFVELMRFQIDRARQYYAAGTPGIFLLPPECRLSILLAARLYALILKHIERQEYDVFVRRASTSLQEKLLTTAGSYLSLRVGRPLTPIHPHLQREVVVL